MKRFLLFITCAYFSAFCSAQPTSGLKAYWPMNGNFTDAGPHSIAVTNNGATATTNYLNAANSAMNFNSPGNTVAQFASHASNVNLNFGTSQDFSLDFSVYINGPFVHNGGLYDNNLNYGGYGVYFWNPNGFLQLQFYHKLGTVGTTNGAINYNTWYHVCLQRSSGTLRIYINGVLNALANEGTTPPVYNFGARFGALFFNAQTPNEYNGLIGKLDEFRIYNRALTLAEIQELTNISLPIKLLSFTATHNKNNVTLNLQTAFEQNSSHINIQRSTDGINYTTIGRLNARGNSSNILTNYNYTDVLDASLQNQKVIYYRLQSVDIDGKSYMSSIVRILNTSSEVQLLVYPNPAKDNLTLSIGSGNLLNTKASILNTEGREVINFVITASVQKINIDHLSDGVYIVRFANGESARFIKIH